MKMAIHLFYFKKFASQLLFFIIRVIIVSSGYIKCNKAIIFGFGDGHQQFSMSGLT